ncbi:MAG: glycosyltransferase family 1 protein [Phycisphaera sp.]|nr:MAG: glycosyltransferase family 1 protein [Phycisphaera sp.]
MVMSGSDNHIRLLMQQPALPAFRVPFFRALASRRGIDFCLLYADGDVPTVPPDGFVAVCRPLKRWMGRVIWDSAHLKRIRPVEERDAWDVHILTWNTRYMSLIPAIRRAKRCRSGVICWGHGYSKSEGAMRSWFRFKTARMADAIVLYSRSVAESYIERGIPAERVFVALNSLDPRPIQEAREKALADTEVQEAFRKEHGLSGPVLLYVSRVYKENRVDRLMQSTRDLAAEFPDIKTVVIGLGPGLDDVKAEAARLGIEDNVIFTGAVYGEENIAPWFLAADAFCYPENIGLSILHAMNHALPVVTSDKIESQNPEIEALRDRENGLLYRHGDTDDMTAKLRELIIDKELSAELAAEAHRTATEDYSTDRMADGMEGAIRFVYEQSLQRRRASR